MSENFQYHEGFLLEINLRKKKWVIGFSYNPHVSSIYHHTDSMGIAIDFLSTSYENFLLVGDYNAEESNNSVKDFCDVCGFKHSTCYKNPNNPKCIDLMLTNKNCSFQNSCAIETGLFDFHKMAVSVLKCYFAKVEP